MNGRNDELIPRYEVAEEALAEIARLLGEWEGTDWSNTRPAQDIAHAVRLANARLRMAGMQRDRRQPRWLARPEGGAYPRGFARRDLFAEDPNPHLCFTIEITNAMKAAKGKKVEVQAPDDQMEFLAKQILSLVELRRRMKAEKGQA